MEVRGGGGWGMGEIASATTMFAPLPGGRERGERERPSDENEGAMKGGSEDVEMEKVDVGPTFVRERERPKRRYTPPCCDSPPTLRTLSCRLSEGVPST